MYISKFEITKIEKDTRTFPHFYTIHFKGIKNKKWIEGKVYFFAKSDEEAKAKAIKRYGGNI